MITVKDVWRGSLPGGTDLLGGGAGLERRVDWATGLRTRPPAFDAVKGGEMAFIPVRSIRLLDERLDLASVMRSFAEKGGVAVAVVGDVSQEAILVAERMMLPLLRLPTGVHLTDVQEATVRYILDQRTLLHERQQELQSQLMEVALAGAGLPALVERLASVTGLATLFQQPDGTIAHRAGPELDAAVVTAVEAGTAAMRRWAEGTVVLPSDPPVHAVPLVDGTSRLLAPVPSPDGIGGYLSVVAGEGELDHVARLAVARAASAGAIELGREHAVLMARDELEGEFIDSLLAGTYSSEAAVRGRAERLGVDLAGDVVVFIARPDPADGTSSRARRDQLLTGTQGWIRRRAPGALSTVRNGVAVVILPVPTGGAPDVRRLAGDLRLECSGALGNASVSVGTGRLTPGIGGVRTSFREAEQAIAMGSRLYGGGRVTAFGDLGLHRLLFAMQGHAELREFYWDQVKPLVEYDRRTGAGLMRTLEAFFRCHGSPTEIAGLLHLHRNTVLYRLRRIEDVGGLRLDDPETRLNLHLCLRVREVLQAAS